MVKQQILDLDPDETIIREILRHPIGIWGWYTFAAVSTLVWLAMLFFSLTVDNDAALNLGNMAYIGIFSFLIILSLAATVIGVHVYKTNELVVTNENLIQVLQFGLFNRQTSQLNLAKVQDVSVDQVGILPNFFGYGTLAIETAGEAANFKFKYVPDPNEAAKVIIEAHEDFIKATHQPSFNRV